MNRNKAQQIITDALGENFVIYRIEESKKYSLAFYKHRSYDLDDQRGHLVGVGPVVFVKETGEYKLLGTGNPEFENYFEDLEETPTPLLTLETIIEKITRHSHVNDDDLFDIQRLWEPANSSSQLSLQYTRTLDYREFVIAEATEEFLSYLENLLWKIGVRVEILDGEALIWRNILS